VWLQTSPTIAAAARWELLHFSCFPCIYHSYFPPIIPMLRLYLAILPPHAMYLAAQVTPWPRPGQTGRLPELPDVL
jgi:hypothetical protein